METLMPSHTHLLAHCIVNSPSFIEMGIIMSFALLADNVYPSDFKMQDSERCHGVDLKDNNTIK